MNIEQTIRSSILTKQNMLEDEALLSGIEKAAALCIRTFQQGGKMLLCGNGGSAADAQHIAAELSGRFAYDRDPLFAEALHVNSSFLTAVANDYDFDEVYSRMVKAAGKKGDVLVGISTSGNSANVLKALEQARKLGMHTIGLTGRSGGNMPANCDLCLRVPSDETARIQEAHILIGHILCESIEQALFPGRP